MDPGRDPTLGYVRDLANLGSTGRLLRRRIEQQAPGLHIVLIADDEPFMRALLTATLSPESYVVLEAATGSETLRLVRTEHPDLVILDVRMPAPDGIAVCRQLKADPTTRDVKVILVTDRTEMN